MPYRDRAARNACARRSKAKRKEMLARQRRIIAREWNAAVLRAVPELRTLREVGPPEPQPGDD